MPYFFVDESGNFGFAFDAGSSPYFVMAFLWTADAEGLRARIRKVRAEHGFSERYEFKHRTIKGQPVVFRHVLETIAALPLEVWVLVIDKRQLPASFQDMDKHEFYNFALGQLVTAIPADKLSGVTLVLDAPASRRSLQQSRVHLSAVLRHRGITPGLRKIVGHDSRRDEALQCADVVAGVVAERQMRGKQEWFSIIESKVVAIAYFPPLKENPPG